MSSHRRLVSGLSALVFGALVLAIVATVSAERTAPSPAVPQNEANGFPLRFEMQGPADSPAYAASALGGRIAVDGGGLALMGGRPTDAWRISFERAVADAKAGGLQPSLGPTHTLVGSDVWAWRRDLVAYRAMRVSSLYPGVDATATGTTDRVTLHLDIAPGADPAAVSIRIDGSTARLESDGTVRWSTSAGDFVLLPLAAWQIADDQRTPLTAAFDMTADGGIALGISGQSADRPVGVDLTVWASRLTATASAGGMRVALDATGAAYVTGPVPARSGAAEDGGDVFVGKLDRAGRDFEWVTYLGGAATDVPRSIAIGPAGRIAVAGAGGDDAFAAELSADGGSLAWTRVLGGSGSDRAQAVAFDALGRIWIAGSTTSPDVPVTADAAQAAPGGGQDAFIAIFGPDGAVAYASYLGGAGDDRASALAKAPGGGIALAGETASAGLATSDAPQLNPGGGQDAFVATYAADGSLVRATYLGGGGDESVAGIALDRSGRIVVAGSVDGAMALPGLRAVGTGGGRDGFIAVLAADGTRFELATRLGGPGTDDVTSLAVDSVGHILMAGRTSGAFPTFGDPRRAHPRGGIDAFVATLDVDGASLLHAGLIGGSAADAASGLAVDGNGRVWLAGATASSDLDGAFVSNSLAPDGDGFVATIADRPAPAAPQGVCPGTINFDNSAGTGLWGTATNWDTNVLPAAGDNVCINGFAVTLSSGAASVASVHVQGAGSLTISNGITLNISGASEVVAPATLSVVNGTIGGTGNLSVDTKIDWTSGTMSGTGATNANGGIDFGGGYTTTTRTVNLGSGGISRFTGAAYSITVTNPGVMTIQAGATFDYQNDGAISGTGTINNAGTFQRTTSTNVGTVSTVFNNTGLVDVQSGTLALSGNGAHTGDFDSTGAILDISAGTQTFSSTSDITGTEVRFTGVSATLSGIYNVTGTTLISTGTVNFTGAGLNIQDVGSTLTVSGGTATFSSGETLTPTTFNFTGGTFGGSDPLTVSGLLTWANGTMSGTGLTTANGGIAFGNGYSTLTRTLNNTSGNTATFSGAAYSLTITTPGVFNNQAGATFDQQCDASITGTGPFNNAGTFLRTTSTNTAVINAPFTNTGLVDVQSGRLNLNSSGNHTGDFDSTGAILEIGTGTQTFSATSDITGTDVMFTGVIATLSGLYNVTGTTTITSGTVNFTGATLNLVDVGSTLTISGGTTTFSSGEAVTPTTLNFSGGTIGGSDNIAVSGLLTWSNGTMGGTGTTTASGGMALGGGYQTLTRTLNNAAGSTATYSGAAYGLTITSPGVFNNQVGATFDQQCDASITGSGPFNNPGTFLRTTSTGTTTISAPFSNTSIVDVQSGRLVLNSNGAHTGDFDATGAILEIGAGTQTFSATSDITASDVFFTGATATLSGTYDVTGTTTITSGLVNFTGATLNLANVGSGLVVSGGTVTFSSGEAVTPTTLNQTGGTIGGSDAITISGLYTWSNGTMGGAGLTTTNGGIALGNGYQTLTRTLNNASGSTATYSGAAYGLTITLPGVFNNQAGATFDQQCDASINGTGTFNNAGTFQRTTSTGTSVVSSIFHNTSVVDVQSGTLSLTGNGTHTGDFDSTGAILDIGGGTQTFSATSDFTGTEVHFTGATATLSGTYDISGTTRITSGTANFTGGTLNLIDVGATLEITNGTATFSSNEALTPTTVNLTGGTLTGSDSITIDGLFTWSNGTMSGNGVTNANGNIELGNGYQALNRTLNNNSGSTATYSGPAYAMTITSPGVFNNQVGATFDQQCDASINGTGIFNNAGTFLRTTSTQPAVVSSVLNNTGTVDVQAGKLSLNGNGTHTGDFDSTGTALIFGGSSTQTFSATSDVTGTEVEFQGSTATFAGTYDVTGMTKVTYGSGNLNFTGAALNLINAGSTIQLDGGTTNFSSGETVTTTNLNMTSYATLTGSDTVIVNGPFSWDGGIMSGTGTTTCRGGIVLGIYSNTMSRTLNNANNGTTTVTGASGGTTITSPGVFNNQAGSTFEASNNYGIYGDGTFNNAGTFNRSVASGQVYVQTTFNNSGTVNVTSGILYFGGYTGSVGNYTQTAGVTRLNGGVIDTYLSLNIAGGILTGTGTITGPVANTGGSVEPGQSPGSLTIDVGGYTQGAGGAYTVEIGGTTAGTQYDQLNVTGTFAQGTATLNGTLNGTLVNGFNPSIGDSFTIITAGTRAGTFSSRNLPPLSGGNVWNVIYTPTTVVLQVAPPTNADLAVTKTDSPDPLNAGGDVTYTVTVHNNGPDTATNVSLSDPLPASTSFVSATPSQGTCSQAAGTVTCPIGSLTNGATATVTIVTTTSGASVPSISNTATASATEADLTSGNNSATATTTVNPVANLTISKTDTPDPVQAGGTITYTVGVNNAGPNDASSVSMTDTLPAGSAFVSAGGTGWTCNNVALTVTCTRGTLAVGTAPDITITATAPGTPGSITNNASVSSTTFDPVTPNTASAGTNVTAVADLTITKGDAPDPVDAGAALTYTLNVSNVGPSTANSVSVTDTLPAGVAFVSATGTGWTCNQAAGVVTCTRATLAVGAAPAITITVNAPAAGGSITNNATATATEFDPSTPNTASATTTVTPVAELSITKTDSPDPANTSSPLTYTVTVTNAGPSTANTLTMTDTLPVGVAFVSATGTGWTCNQAAGVVTCTRATLAVAAAPAITIVVTTPATPGLITNSATIAATEADRVPGNNTATAATSVAVVTADLSITKTDSPDPVNAGATLTYTINVSNAGPDPATLLSVSDTLPAGTAFVSATGTGWTCNNVAGTVTCTRPALAVGAAPAITITVTAPAAGGSISNTATVSATEADNNAANNSATATTNVTAIADLTIAKTDSPDPIAAGGALTYTINVSNAGPSTATSLSVVDVLPAGTAFVSATGTGWTCNNVTGTVTCTRATLAVGAAPAITIAVTAPSSPGSISNTATVTATETDPTTPNTSTATTNVTAVADLTITKGDAPDPVDAGAALTYTLNVSNAGPSTANSVSVTDTLPAGVAFVSATGTGWTCNQAAGVVTCTRATLAVGAAPAITITVNAPAAGGSITNNATATATEFDPTTPNTASATTTVTPIANLSITKTDSPDPANTSSPLTYTVTVTNAGPSTANTLTMTDTLPVGVAFVSATGTGWTCNQAAGVVTCTRATLAVAAAPAITIVVTTSATPGLITNSATIAATEADRVPGNNTATAATSVAVVTADLSITKTDSPDPVNAGATLTYTINVSNAGPDPATLLSVSDTLPAGTAFVSATGTGWTCNNVAGTVTCTRPALAVGAAPAITITVTAPAAGGSISNTATVSATEADNNAANNSATATTNVTAIADLTIAKTDSPDPIAAGGALTYTINVSNAGPSTATSLSVVDVLPAGTAFVSATGTGWTCNNVTGTVTCTRATLAVGAAPAITIAVTAPSSPGSISNTATVTATETDPTTPNTSTATTNVTAVADLTITKGDAPDPVDAGAALTYTLNVSNAGPSTANSVSVTDTLPAGVAFVSATGTGWTCNQAAGVVTCTRATLAVGAAPAITITVNAPAAGGSITNNATATATEFDPTTPNTASATTTVTPLANLSITKTDSPDPANTSSPLTYTVTVTNAGPSTANTLTMTDTLPAGVAFVSATGTGWTCNQAAGVVTCTRATLAVGAAPAITIVVTTPATSGVITNTATIAAASPADPTPGNNTATAGTSVAVVTADMAIVKTDTPDPVNAGANLTYTLAVSNGGPDPANSVSVVDTLPAGVVFVSATGTGWTCNHVAGTVTCTRATLAVGAAPAITIVVTAPAAGGSLNNSAVVSAAEADSTPGNNTSTVSTTVTAIADLSLTKTDSPDPVAAGASLTYTINVSNAGPSPAANASVTDTLPAGVVFVSAAGTGWTCNNVSGTVTCTRAVLTVGAAPAITITVTAPANGGSITNSATATSATTDPVAGNNTASAGTTVTAVNNLSIVKTASSSTVAATADFSYTLAVSNAGPSTTGTVTVTDPLPAGAVYQSASGTGWTCSQASGTVTCTRSSLTVGAAPAITINVRAPNSAATLTNTATVATANDPTPGNNTSTVVVTVTAAADLRVTKTASVSSILDDSNLTYTVSVRNAGPSTATNVVVTDNLPGDATLVSAAGPGWTCSQSLGGTGTVTCTRPSLGITTAPAITIVVHVYTYGKGGTVCNTASADSAESDPTPSNDSSQACVEVVQGGSCNSVQDLLAEVEIGSIAQTQKLQMVRILLTAISASNTGQGKVVAQRLAIFMKQVSAAEARGAVDSETADSLDACAASLRRQYVTGAGSRSANRR